MRIWRITELDDRTGKFTAIHFIMAPHVVDKGFYNEVRAYNSFNSKMRRKGDKFYRYKDVGDDFFRGNLSKDYQEIRHRSIYEFFEYIGYDRKKKTFSKGSKKLNG
jgi:hypothetical protein